MEEKLVSLILSDQAIWPTARNLLATLGVAFVLSCPFVKAANGSESDCQ